MDSLYFNTDSKFLSPSNAASINPRRQFPSELEMAAWYQSETKRVATITENSIDVLKGFFEKVDVKDLANLHNIK